MSEFTLPSGERDLTGLQFDARTVDHPFCSTCGIQLFAIGSNPSTGDRMAAINV